MLCKRCHERPAARILKYCARCIRRTILDSELLALHTRVRRDFSLSHAIPRGKIGRTCKLCANECRIAQDSLGFCGIRKNVRQRITNRTCSIRKALAYAYYDPLPTNCCASWFCRGSNEKGYNLAVFFYGCNFNCLFCQNASHKKVDGAPVLDLDMLIEMALRREVRCVCFFGGSPEPHFPFALRAAEVLLRQTRGKCHICWEWNGAGHPALVRKAAELSLATGGTVKFDMKAWDPKLHRALCGVGNRQTWENFRLLAELYSRQNPDLLTATTLLVPYYVDAEEVEAISHNIAELNRDIPYSLLVFHPDFLLDDLPVTPASQVRECLARARKHLKRVHVGNLHLLGMTADFMGEIQ